MTTVTADGAPVRAAARAVRLLAGLAVCLATGAGGALLPTGSAAATSTTVPEMGLTAATERQEGPAGRERQRDRLLAQALREREQALDVIDQQAEQHEDALAAELAAEKARLAALGHNGDLQDLTHVLPLAGYHLSAGFGLAGPLWESTHTGLDFGAASGTPLVAIGDGTVTSVGDAGPYGLRTVLTLEDGTDLWYAHQLSAMVETGQQVEAGEPIGLVGSTGNSTGPHLHLEVRPAGGTPVDPVAWLGALDLSP